MKKRIPNQEVNNFIKSDVTSEKNIMNLQLTQNQIWFIKCAIDLKNYVLPLGNSLNDTDFKEDYGISKEDIEKEIKNLKDEIFKKTI
jgi:hypothetical protein